MKLSVTDKREVLLEEVYSGVLLRTAEGNEIGICMRDDTFEINIMPKGCNKKNWWRINMQEAIAMPQTAELQAENERLKSDLEDTNEVLFKNTNACQQLQVERDRFHLGICAIVADLVKAEQALKDK